MVPTEIPKGFKTLLPEEARRRRKILSRMEDIIRLWGYDPIFPPSIEYLATFKSVDEKLEEISFKVVDRMTGRLMAVRPDFTPQIARIVATSFRNDDPPFRFYYAGGVFRDTLENRELFQFGFELIGVRESEADAEIVAVVVNILEELGLKSFQIDIGHSEFLLGALDELGIPRKEDFLKLLFHKDLSGVEAFLDANSIKGVRREKALKLLELYGGEEVLEHALLLFENERSRSAVGRLLEVLSILKSYGFEKRIIFDLSERKGMKYHTGVTFEVFHPLSGFSIGMGGRYDQLLGMFGASLPATGMAIDVDALQSLLERKNVLTAEKKDFYIIDLKKEKAYQVARALRNMGYTVARDIIKRDPEESVRVAFDKGFRYVIVLNRSEPPFHLLYLSPERSVSLEGDIVKAIKSALLFQST